MQRKLSISADFASEITFPPEDFLFEWLIGKFLIEFQQLELHLCAWLSDHMQINMVDMAILLKDSNFNQKLDILGNIFPRVDTRTKEKIRILNELRSINALRNKLAHGLIINSEGKLYLSMPSRDFFEVADKHLINEEILLKEFQKCRNMSAYFVLHRLSSRRHLPK